MCTFFWWYLEDPCSYEVIKTKARVAFNMFNAATWRTVWQITQDRIFTIFVARGRCVHVRHVPIIHWLVEPILCVNGELDWYHWCHLNRCGAILTLMIYSTILKHQPKPQANYWLDFFKKMSETSRWWLRKLPRGFSKPPLCVKAQRRRRSWQSSWQILSEGMTLWSLYIGRTTGYIIYIYISHYNNIIYV
jgi:hypothetical protein